ncbi:MAG TPA: hypothetical protein VF875_08005, partial [Anaeromyxobacter sp.]
LVLTLGETATLDPFLLAKHVQGSGGRLKLTPDMKLVAALGDAPRRPPPPRAPRRGVTGAKAVTAARVQAAVAAAMAAPTPAQEAAAGRELLEAARKLLGELAGCARPG